MDSNKEIKKIDKELKVFYNEEDYGEIAKEWIHENIEESLEDEDTHPITFYDFFSELSEDKLDDTLWVLYTKQEKEEAKKYFTQSTAYGYLHVKTADTLWGCFAEGERFSVRVKQEYTFMSVVARYMGQSLICGWEKEANYLAQSMINSIEFGKQEEEGYTIHRLIADGFAWDLAAWFALELYCKVYDKTFDRKKAEYPKSMVPYDTVLKNWDSKDLQEIDKLTFLLCEKHIEQSQEQKGDQDYFEFGATYNKLFPYEIFTWFKYREKAGLKNPKTFTHPLMNTPIAKMFLDIKEPLPKPTELPYAKELLDKLQEQCPDVEVPEWLDENNEDILPDDFMK